MKIQKSKKIKQITAFLLSAIMTITVVPVVEISSFAEETTKIENSELSEEFKTDDLIEVFNQSISDYYDTNTKKVIISDNKNTERNFNFETKYYADETSAFKEKYDDVEKYVADCVLWGFIDPASGTKYDFYREYPQVYFHNYAYEEFAAGILESKWLAYTGRAYTVMTKLISDGPNAVNNLTPEAMYEVILMDYLNYKTESDKKISQLTKKSAKYAKTLADKFIDYRLDKGLDISTDSVKNMTIGEAQDFIEKWEKYDKISNDLGEIISVGTAGIDYIKDMIELGTLLDAKDENVNFLLDVKEKAKADGNKDLCNAIDIVVAKTNSAFYDTMASKTTYDNVLDFAMGKAWDLIASEIPGMKGLKLSIGTVNLIFNTDDVSANTIKVLLFYTFESYAKLVVADKREYYCSNINNSSAENFNGVFSSYAKWQGYASDFAGSFVSAINNGGWFQKIANYFSSKNKQQDEYWKNRINSDKTFSDGAAKHMETYREIYMNYFNFSNIFMNEIDIPNITKENVDTEIEFLSDSKYFTLVIDENTKLTSDVECEGLVLNGDLDLDGHTLTVNNDVEHEDHIICINNGTLNINGDYNMENITVNNLGEAEYNNCYATLYMKNQHDKVNISGNFTTHNLKSNDRAYLQCGTLIVSGDIWSDNAGIFAQNLPDGDNIIILNGTENQSIYLSEMIGYVHPGLNRLKVLNSNKRNIIWCGELKVEKFESDINIIPENLTLGSFDLNQYNMTIDGNISMTSEHSKINLNGGLLNINGNLIQKNGIITINNGTLNISGNYNMENINVNNVDEIEYNGCYATLYMKNQHDKVNISGNFTTHNLKSNDRAYLQYGILTVGGDIWSDSAGIFAQNLPDGDNIIILNGTENQSIYLSEMIGYVHPGLNRLKVLNSNKRNIIWCGELKVEKFESDINIIPENLTLGSFDLNQYNMTIDGNVSMTSEHGRINLDGGMLTINGNLLQNAGTIVVNNGTLNVIGNYNMEDNNVNNIGEIEYNNCSAILYMQNQHDKINISGDFISHNLKFSGYIKLEEGTLSVGGDIWSDGGISTLLDKHKTVLVGNKKQSIRICDTEKLDILVITKPIDNYTFSPNECWNNIITINSANGDANMDDKITVADAVLLQKYLVNKETFNKAQKMLTDLNSDGKIDVFDMILLRRLILKIS